MAKATKEQVKVAALDFLQGKAALDLRRNISNLTDVQFEDGKIVLVVRGTIKDVPALEHNGIKFDVSVKEAENVPQATVTETEFAKKAKEVLNRYPSVKSVDVEKFETETAISPDGTYKIKDTEAYRAWQNRHKNVKKGK